MRTRAMSVTCPDERVEREEIAHRTDSLVYHDYSQGAVEENVNFLGGEGLKKPDDREIDS